MRLHPVWQLLHPKAVASGTAACPSQSRHCSAGAHCYIVSIIIIWSLDMSMSSLHASRAMEVSCLVLMLPDPSSAAHSQSLLLVCPLDYSIVSIFRYSQYLIIFPIPHSIHMACCQEKEREGTPKPHTVLIKQLFHPSKPPISAGTPRLRQDKQYCDVNTNGPRSLFVNIQLSTGARHRNTLAAISCMHQQGGGMHVRQRVHQLPRFQEFVCFHR